MAPRRAKGPLPRRAPGSYRSPRSRRSPASPGPPAKTSQGGIRTRLETTPSRRPAPGPRAHVAAAILGQSVATHNSPARVRRGAVVAPSSWGARLGASHRRVPAPSLVETSFQPARVGIKIRSIRCAIFFPSCPSDARSVPTPGPDGRCVLYADGAGVRAGSSTSTLILVAD